MLLSLDYKIWTVDCFVSFVILFAGTSSTLLENLKLCTKFNFQKKDPNSEFEFLNDFLRILNAIFTWIIWIFAPKIVILFKYRIQCNIMTTIHSFLARKFKFTKIRQIEFLDTIYHFLTVCSRMRHQILIWLNFEWIKNFLEIFLINWMLSSNCTKAARNSLTQKSPSQTKNLNTWTADSRLRCIRFFHSSWRACERWWISLDFPASLHPLQLAFTAFCLESYVYFWRQCIYHVWNVLERPYV